MNAHRTTPSYSPWPHRLSAALVCITFPLILVGGLVTTYDAGMAVPDWPSTYGYNLFLYPWTTWIFGPFDLLIEHGHRQLGGLAGIVTIALVFLTWRLDTRRWVRWMTVVALVLVCVQGILGGVRVLRDDRMLALIHGCVGPAFFAMIVVLTAVLSRWWHDVRKPLAHPNAAALQRLSLVTLGLAYVQLVLGANIRHAPPDGSTQSFRIAVYFHIGTALVLAGHALWLAVRMRDRRIDKALQRPALLVAILVVCQLLLGGSVWVLKYGWPMGLSETMSFAGTTIVADSMLQALSRTAHAAMGSLILATSAWTATRSLHFFGFEPPRDSRVALTWEVAR